MYYLFMKNINKIIFIVVSILCGHVYGMDSKPTLQSTPQYAQSMLLNRHDVDSMERLIDHMLVNKQCYKNTSKMTLPDQIKTKLCSLYGTMKEVYDMLRETKHINYQNVTLRPSNKAHRDAWELSDEEYAKLIVVFCASASIEKCMWRCYEKEHMNGKLNEALQYAKEYLTRDSNIPALAPTAKSILAVIEDCLKLLDE